MRRTFLPLFIFLTVSAAGQFKASQHQAPQGGEVPVTGSGSFAEPGTTYKLMNDISTAATSVFLGKDVTLDLNGYTIRFADGAYEHIPNPGFEEGASGWDLSKAPGAKVVSTEEVHVFVGKKILSMKKGDEIVSPYINLPVANRSYFAMCGVTGFDYRDMQGDMNNQMRVSIYVDNEAGEEVRLTTTYGDTTLMSVPVMNRSPRLGGGFVYAHIHGLPSGRYRVRVKAETDCLVDEIDIRPAMDVGIGIVERTYPMGHYDHLYNGTGSAFFDYTKDRSKGTPVDSIPVARGRGTVTIRNGTIENASQGVVSWGVQSTAEDVRVILDNVKIITSGINTIAVDVPSATITNCRFEVDNPFIVNRHGSGFYAVDLRGSEPSEVSFSEFIGGQGCLVFKGKKSSIHHNYFVNKQTVTNHYSIMAMGDSSRIYENRIEPETGSGIEIYVHKFIDIFNNRITINTSPPTCEYGHEEYSTAAIRLADYRAKPNSPRGCYGNRVFNNKIQVRADAQPGVDTYVPMAWAVYYSASGGDNDIFGNEIEIYKPDLDSRAVTTAFYISGGTEGFGGKFYNNTIRTNVIAAWIGTVYGGAANSRIFKNTIIRSGETRDDFKPFRMGSLEGADRIARNIEFRSNEIVGSGFAVDATEQEHSYGVYWTLSLTVVDAGGTHRRRIPIRVVDRNGRAVYAGVTDDAGSISCELPEYVVTDGKRTDSSPYTVEAGRTRKQVELNRNTSLTLAIRK